MWRSPCSSPSAASASDSGVEDDSKEEGGAGSDVVGGHLAAFPIFIHAAARVPLAYAVRDGERAAEEMRALTGLGARAANKEAAELAASGRFAADTWLTAATIDALILYLGQEGDPEPRQKRPRGAGAAAAALAAAEGGAAYLGSTFTPAMLGQMDEGVLAVLRAAAAARGLLALCLNVGQHWVLLVLQPGHVALFDPMRSTRLDARVVCFAARLAGRADAATERLAGGGSLSVRTQLPRMPGVADYFSVHSVAVQLRHHEGFNCGLYAALWARHVLRGGRAAEMPVPGPAEVAALRVLWQARLSARPRFVRLAAAAREEAAAVEELAGSVADLAMDSAG